MQYKSTRNSGLRMEASEVIVQGISSEGGLFVPEKLPDVKSELPVWADFSYKELAKKIFQLFLTDFSEEEIDRCVESSYTMEKFGGEPVKLISLPQNTGNAHLLELWHGPTCAFKDMALQILPYFLTVSLSKSAADREAVILVATSGDTGKAALEGFRDVPGTRVMVFYPQNGVSPMQKRQMATQDGRNVAVCAIEGNFDDAQTAVKKIFTDNTMKTALEDHCFAFSSANSINWGRLLPQIVYYFYAYFQLCKGGKLAIGEPMNVAVPTGNFGNILAAYYARKMGLPIKKLICASNANNVLTDFINTGTYDCRREFYATSSPSMDILISSNLERLLYALSGEDSAVISGWMEQLSDQGQYSVGNAIHTKVKELFYGGFCEDSDTARTIKDTWQRCSYLADTHTAVALNVYSQYVESSGDGSTPTVIASTASPYKFVGDVLGAMGALGGDDEFDNISQLESLTGTHAPDQLKTLRDKPIRFTSSIDKSKAACYVLETLGIGE